LATASAAASSRRLYLRSYVVKGGERFGDGMLGVADTCPHFMCSGHVAGGIELLGVETHARPRVIAPWIGPAVGDRFWVWVAKSEIETGFNSRGGDALTGSN
jgi:hypothetical protein